MADELTVHIVGLDPLIADLVKAQEIVRVGGPKVTGKGGLNIKKDWRQRWLGIRHAPRLPYSISYDTTVRKTEFETEVGPEDDKAKQGFLAPIIEFGGIHNAPTPGGLPALQAEEPRFVTAVEELAKLALP